MVDKVLVTGANGFLGTHLCNALRKKDIDPLTFSSHEYDLRYRDDVDKLFLENKGIKTVFHLAANVGGIGYNQHNAYNLFYDNMIMGLNLIHLSISFGVEKFIQIGTVCGYPKFCPTPFIVDNFWNGYPEETNAPYGIAKKALLTQLHAARDQYGFNGIYLLPANIYGPGDNFNPEESHVIPALIKKTIEAKENDEPLHVWGTGRAGRDFIYVMDAVDAIIKAAENYDRKEPLNLGSGNQIFINVLVKIICDIVGFKNQIIWDGSKPDGQPKRMLDIRNTKKILDWKPTISLKEGLEKTILWYQSQL